MTFSWFSYIPANFQMPYLTWCEILNFPLNYFTLNISLCMWPLNSFMSVYLILFQALIIKVRTFWEAHKNLRNLPHALYIYLVNVQTMRKIFSNFVCFSESPNFTGKCSKRNFWWLRKFLCVPQEWDHTIEVGFKNFFHDLTIMSCISQS